MKAWWDTDSLSDLFTLLYFSWVKVFIIFIMYYFDRTLFLHVPCKYIFFYTISINRYFEITVADRMQPCLTCRGQTCVNSPVTQQHGVNNSVFVAWEAQDYKRNEWKTCMKLTRLGQRWFWESTPRGEITGKTQLCKTVRESIKGCMLTLAVMLALKL